MSLAALADRIAACATAMAERFVRGGLSGGVFQNLLLLDRVRTGLAAAGLRVLTHTRVPANDGGISLGQVAVAAALAQR